MGEIECPACSTRVPAENKFCTDCGFKMEGFVQLGSTPPVSDTDAGDDAAAATGPLPPLPSAHVAPSASSPYPESPPRPLPYGLVSRGTVASDPQNIQSFVAYDPQIIRSFANALYRRADEIVLMSTIIGALIGAAFGFAVLAVLSSSVGMVAMLLGVVGGGYFGRRRGIAKTFQLRLEAQLALCQVELELNTRRFRDEA